MGKVEAEDLESRVNNLSKEVSSMGNYLKNLKENMKVSETEKIFTAQNTENNPYCNNCHKYGNRTNPCLNGKKVTLENFRDGTKVAGQLDGSFITGYLHRGGNGFGNTLGGMDGKWLQPYLNGMKQEPKSFTKDITSLMYKC